MQALISCSQKIAKNTMQGKKNMRMLSTQGVKTVTKIALLGVAVTALPPLLFFPLLSLFLSLVSELVDSKDATPNI